MLETVKQKLYDVIERYEDLAAILISTSEGVPLLKVEHGIEEKDDMPFELAETSLPSVFAAAAEQAGKLKFGNVSLLTCFFHTTTLIHINYLPLVITLIVEEGKSIGGLIDLNQEIKNLLTSLKKVVETTESN